jgi:glutaminase
VRLTTLDPGVAFGEMALVDGAPRSADIFADTDVSVYILSLERLEALSRTAPAVHAGLLRNIGRELSQRLRKANREIRSFTEVAA